MQTVQLVLADAVFAAAVREALMRSGPWHVVSGQAPDPEQTCVLVLDAPAFARMRRALRNPERIVLITQKDPEHLSEAWDAGIVSVVSDDDPPNTILLAIMAAALRVPRAQAVAILSGISPNPPAATGPIPPENRHSGGKRCKTQ